MKKPKAMASYGPVQLSEHLAVPLWKVERAVGMGLIPPADRKPRRWSARVVAEVRDRLDDILAAVGTVPDLGASRAASVLTGRLGTRVDSDTVLELARMGVVAEVGDYKGYPIYSGRDLETFAESADLDLLARAARRGRLLTAGQAADFLRIRPSDFGHLVRARWIVPGKWVHSEWRARSASPDCPLYRTGDLEVLLANPAIDWDAVRATPKGRPSPLARLTGPAGGDARGGAR